MSYSYQANGYPQAQMPVTYYNEPTQRKNNGGGFLGTVVGGAAVGATTSAGIAAFQNPYIDKNGVAKDYFVREVCENTIKNSSDETKKYYEQVKNIIKEVDTAKTPDDLKKILNDNDLFFKKHLGEINTTAEEYLKGIKSDNLGDFKEHFKTLALDKEREALSHHKINIEMCWDKEAKKFVHAEGVEENVFKSIEKSKSGMKLKNIGKSALKGAGIGLAVALIFSGVFKLLQNKNR